jgi:hypothetical protein
MSGGDLTRRRLFQAAGAAGVAAGVTPRWAGAIGPQEPLFLTAPELRFLSAACDTLIPRDAHPSATEAGVIGFIDRQLAGPYGRGEGLYLEGPFFEGTPGQGWQLGMTPAAMMRAGMAAADREADEFASLMPSAQIEFLKALEEQRIDLGEVPSGLFFSELLSLTNEGYFADPAYGGNREYAGWELVGFPGAHAYYLDSVDRWNMAFDRQPYGMTHQPGAPGGGTFAPLRRRS